MSDELKQFLIQLDLIGVKLPCHCWPYMYLINEGNLVRRYVGNKHHSRTLIVSSENYLHTLKRIIYNRRSCERQREGTE